jgi:hypothetical protein
MKAARILAAALAVASFAAIDIAPALAERGDVPGTSECLKVLRRDGNYLVCPDGKGGHVVYKLPSTLSRD